MQKSVLIAEDEPYIAQSLQFLLERAGFQVTLAFDGRETLDRLAAKIPDILLLDLMMEHHTGFDVLAKLREMLLGHPKITEDPARVRFAGFGDYSLNVEIFAYADTPDWNQFLAIQEDVYLRIMDIVKEAGTGFAFPSQTTYYTRDSGLGKEQAEAAEAEVQAWRSDGTLPFPEFAQVHRERMLNTLVYPPEGAPPPAAMSETPVHTARRWLGLKWRRKKAAE